MRRVLLLVSAIMLVDTTFYSALTPLLPHYEDELGLSKTGVGVLTAAFGVGVLVGALPAGALAARVGPKAVVLVGLGLLSSTSLAFAFGESALLLDLARFGQGFGGACTWTGALALLVAHAPRERRGELIGSAIGAGIAGALLGPVVGSAAALVGTGIVFGCVALAGAAIAGAVLLTDGARPEQPQTLGHLRSRLRERRLLAAMWLVTLPSILFAVLSVLAPLELHDLGVGAAGIGAVFLVSAAAEAAVSPLVGRLADRRGSRAIVRVAVLASAAATVVPPLAGNRLALGGAVVVAGLAYGIFWVPAMTGLLEGTESLGLDPSFAFALMNLAWAAGQGVGSLGGGGLAEAAGDVVPFWSAAALCLATLVFLGLTRSTTSAYAKAT